MAEKTKKSPKKGAKGETVSEKPEVTEDEATESPAAEDTADQKADADAEQTSEESEEGQSAEAEEKADASQEEDSHDDSFYEELDRDLSIPAEPGYDEPDHGEEAHPTLAGRVLSGLFIMAVGGGLALWGGPKLAPHLPAGLAPVAQFLSPGTHSAAIQVENLKAEMEPRLVAIEAGAASGADEQNVQAAVAAAMEDMQARLDALETGDGENAQGVDGRLAQVETRLEGVMARLDTLSADLSGQGTASAGLSEETRSQLKGYQSTLDGLRAEIDALTSKYGSMSDRMEEVAASTALTIDQARTDVNAAEKKHLAAEIDRALDQGSAYGDALSRLASLTGQDAPEPLSALADGGPSLASLRADFSNAAHAALRAANKSAAADGGAGSRIGAFLKSQIGIRSSTPRAGDDPDAILSRVEALLNEGDLTAAVTEAESLPEEAKSAMSDWLAQATAIAGAKSALVEFSGANPATN